MKKEKIFAFSILGLFATIMLASLVSAANDWQNLGFLGTFLRYIFGPVTDITSNPASNIIITAAVWLLIMFTFADIISTFSTFSPMVSWVSAAMIGIIAANLGWITRIIAIITGIFAALGALAVYVGLGAAFVVFIGVNLGIWQLRGWIIRRRALMEASKAKAGGAKLAGRIAGLAKAGAELEKM